MEMFYLLIAIGGDLNDAKSAILIPEKYPSEQACRIAGRTQTLGFTCIPAPDTTYCNQSIPNFGNVMISVPCSSVNGAK